MQRELAAELNEIVWFGRIDAPVALRRFGARGCTQPACAPWHTERVLLNLSPLRRYREFRLLFIGQTVSLLGSMLTYVAVPYQIYQLTNSSWLVGMVSAAQLLPVLALGLLGGAIADRLDRRRLLVWSEVLLTVGAAALAVNAARAAPSVQLIFAMAVCMQAVNAFHRQWTR